MARQATHKRSSHYVNSCISIGVCSWSLSQRQFIINNLELARLTTHNFRKRSGTPSAYS